MRKKLLLVAGLLLASLVGVWARPVDPVMARRVAETYMRHAGMENVAALQDVTAQTPFASFYVFAAPEGGFILVSADDCVVPVLGYSVDKPFETKDMPENVRGWLDSYDSQIAWVREQDAERDGTLAALVAGQWQALLDGDILPAPLTTAVSPLITTTWNQAPRYNNLCPYESSSSAYTVTGCVATATAQIMKYFNHPATGYGSHSYTSSQTAGGVTYTYGPLSANFGATTYQWANMPAALTSASSQAQIDAVATLMYHIGVADEMSYGISSIGGSGAHNYNYGGYLVPSSQSSLMAYFKYCPDMAAIARADYSDSAFCALMRAELDQSRPILYSGRHTSGGHSFVCDGYNANGQFHFNWGWGGSQDGYFTMGSLNPGTGGIGGNGSGTYNMDNVILTRIRPNTNWGASATTTITTQVTGNVTGASVIGAGTYPFADTVALLVSAPTGYRFDSWSDGSRYNYRELFANGGSYTFTANVVPIAGDTITYCPGGVHMTSFGGGGGEATWGIRIPASSLAADRGLAAVRFYAPDAGTYGLKVYAGAVSSTSNIYMASLTVSDEGWQQFTLPATQALQPGQDLYIILNNSDVSYPAALTGYSGNPDGCLWGTSQIGIDTAWGYYYTFMIKAVMGSTQPMQQYTLTVQANNAAWGTVTGGGTYYENTTATLTATPNTGYRFVRWSDNDLNATRIVTVTQNATYTAIFEPVYTITVQSNNTNWGTVSGGGTYNLNATATLVATPRTGYRFVQWHDGNTQNIRQITVTQNATYTATFEEIPPQQYTITVVSNNPDWGTVTGGGTYVEGTHITIRANSNPGYRFVQWQEDGNPSIMRQITVTQNATYTAIFDTNFHTLTVTSNNDDWGTVTGGGSYQEGSQVTITATPTTGHRFVQWQDGDTNATRVVTVNFDVTYTATFEEVLEQYVITAFSSNPNFGTVTGGGTYLEGSQVTLTATSAAGCRFVRWNDGVTDSVRVITVTQDATYIATFSNTPPTPTFTITVLSSDTTMGTVSGGGEYESGTMVSISATAKEGYVFVQWNDGNPSATRYIAVLGDATYTATFATVESQTFTITVLSSDSTMGIVEGGGQFLIHQSAIIKARPYGGYDFKEWNDGNTNNPRTISVEGDATYTAIFVPRTVGIDDVESASVTLSPNPAATVATLAGMVPGTEVTLVDINGRSLAVWRTEGESLDIEVASLPEGLYILRATTPDGTVARKLIVRH